MSYAGMALLGLILGFAVGWVAARERIRNIWTTQGSDDVKKDLWP